MTDPDSARSQLEGSAVVITGGASGLGRASADAVAAAGAAVMIADRDPDELALAESALQRHGTPVASRLVDVTDQAAVEELFDATLAAFGRVDGVVTSAGVLGAGEALDITEADFDRVLRVNLIGTFLCAQAGAQAMLAAGHGGSIVTLASTVAFSGRERAAAYTASKGGVIALTKTLAIEWGPHGIRVNAVAPGLIDTPISATISEEHKQAYASRTPLGRIGVAQDISKVVRFVLGDESAYVTGQTIVVNGGHLMPA